MQGTMRVIEAGAFDIGALRLAERPIPPLRRGELLVRLKAASLNYRDLAILSGAYMPGLPLPYVPASDGAGEVVEVGEDVTRFKPGERVVPIYTQGWYDGKPTPGMRTKRTLGVPLAGTLAQYIVVPSRDVVAAPAHLSDREAACLPIAGVTAWTTLQTGGVKPGDVVLVLGTGGVALFALQFAKHAGATVIVTSSSDDKLARAKALGADIGINYRSTPKWEAEVRAASGGRGADIVVETGGATLAQSLAATAFGGFVGVVGFVAGYEATLPVRALIRTMARVQGIAVGPRAGFEAMNRAISAGGLHPVIDSTFPLADAAAAFTRMKAGAHFGKIVIDIAG